MILALTFADTNLIRKKLGKVFFNRIELRIELIFINFLMEEHESDSN